MKWTYSCLCTGTKYFPGTISLWFEWTHLERPVCSSQQHLHWWGDIVWMQIVCYLPRTSNNKIWICSGETYSVILQRDFFGPPQYRLWKWGTQSTMKKVGTITSPWVGGSFWEPMEAPLVKGCWFPFRTGLKPGIPEWHRSSQRWKGNIPVCELWKCTLKPKVTRLRWYFCIPTMS